jgi:hypothetical protein
VVALSASFAARLVGALGLLLVRLALLSALFLGLLPVAGLALRAALLSATGSALLSLAALPAGPVFPLAVAAAVHDLVLLTAAALILLAAGSAILLAGTHATVVASLFSHLTSLGSPRGPLALVGRVVAVVLSARVALVCVGHGSRHAWRRKMVYGFRSQSAEGRGTRASKLDPDCRARYAWGILWRASLLNHELVGLEAGFIFVP